MKGMLRLIKPLTFQSEYLGKRVLEGEDERE